MFIIDGNSIDIHKDSEKEDNLDFYTSLYAYNGQIYGRDVIFDFPSNTFVKNNEIKNGFVIDRKVKSGTYYRYEEDDENTEETYGYSYTYKLYFNDKLIIENIHDYYPTESGVYYFTTDNNKYNLNFWDLSTEKTTLLTQLPYNSNNYGISNMLFDGKYIAFTLTTGENYLLEAIDINNTKDLINIVKESEYFITFNIYNGFIYYTDSNEIVRCDIAKNTKELVYFNNSAVDNQGLEFTRWISAITIVDDKWIYFEEYNIDDEVKVNVYRFEQTGKKIELVLNYTIE